VLRSLVVTSGGALSDEVNVYICHLSVEEKIHTL